MEPDAAPAPVTTIEQFKELMVQVRNARRSLVHSLLAGGPADSSQGAPLQAALGRLQSQRTNDGHGDGDDDALRVYDWPSGKGTLKVRLNIADELAGLRSDVSFCRLLADVGVDRLPQHFAQWAAGLVPDGGERDAFRRDTTAATRLLRSAGGGGASGAKPVLITDWDGTMKTYSSQYATCMQPACGALVLAMYAKRCTRLAAVLTAGPLCNPGILDLTCIPPDGWLCFGGSWGREWLLHGRRLVDDADLTRCASDSLDSLVDNINSLLEEGAAADLEQAEVGGDTDLGAKAANGHVGGPADGAAARRHFGHFRMVGSGFQRKVDRVSLGIQSVSGGVSPGEQADYVRAVRRCMAAADPHQRYLTVHGDRLDMEICLRSGGGRDQDADAHDAQSPIWDKALGVQFLLRKLDEIGEPIGDLTQHSIVVCGDTGSDVPMVRYAAGRNPRRTYAIFVRPDEATVDALRRLLPDERLCFVSTPQVIHSAMANVLCEQMAEH